MIILTRWHLWKERNRRTFDQKELPVADLLLLISDEIVLWCNAGLHHFAPVAAGFGRISGREIVLV